MSRELASSESQDDYYPPSIRKLHGLDNGPQHRSRRVTSGSSSDITWVPGLERHSQRRKRVVASTALETEVPAGWPTAVHGPLVWSGTRLHANRFILQLTRKHMDEIEHALQQLRDAQTPYAEITPATFQLATFGEVLERECRGVHDDGGFVVLRGLDPSKYGRVDNLRIYLGISSYFGRERARQALDGRIISEWHGPCAAVSVAYVNNTIFKHILQILLLIVRLIDNFDPYIQTLDKCVVVYVVSVLLRLLTITLVSLSTQILSAISWPCISLVSRLLVGRLLSPRHGAYTTNCAKRGRTSFIRLRGKTGRMIRKYHAFDQFIVLTD